MNQKELKELIEFLIEKDIAEFELERGDVKVRIKRGSEPVASSSAPDTRFFTVHAAPPPAPAAARPGGDCVYAGPDPDSLTWGTSSPGIKAVYRKTQGRSLGQA